MTTNTERFGWAGSRFPFAPNCAVEAVEAVEHLNDLWQGGMDSAQHIDALPALARAVHVLSGLFVAAQMEVARERGEYWPPVLEGEAAR